MANEYIVKVISLVERKKLIEDLWKTPTKQHYPETFQGKYQEFDVHEVTIDFPVYRLENGRTKAAQREHMATKGLDADYFDDTENVDAQVEQHEVLKIMIDKEGLRDHLRINEQTIPLILDHSGTVINGNRRLCTMRELVTEDTDKYKTFKHIKVIFLPPCSVQDIYELESNLQLIKDVKAKYSWIGEAFQLKDIREKMKYDDVTLMKHFDKKTKKEVQDTIDKIVLVDTYLDSRNKSSIYSILENSEYAFIELQKHSKKIIDPKKKDFFVQGVFALIDQTVYGGKKGRIYKDIKDLFDCLDLYYAKAIKEAQESGFEIESKGEESAGDLDLLGGPAEEDNKVSINDIASSVEGRKLLAEVAKEAIATHRDASDIEDQKTYSIKLLSRVNSLLDEVVSGLDWVPDKEAIKKQLERVDENLEQIRDWLSDSKG